MKVFIKTFGCQSNYGDSEVLAGLLKQKEIEIVNDIEESDTVIVNSCGVKHVTQNRVIDYINKLSTEKEVYVGGCLPRMIDMTKHCPSVKGLFDTNSILQVPQLLQQKKVSTFTDNKDDRKDGNR